MARLAGDGAHNLKAASLNSAPTSKITSQAGHIRL